MDRGTQSPGQGLRFTLHLLRTFRYESDFRYPSREFYALGFLRSVLAWGLVQIVPFVSVGVSLQQAMGTPDRDSRFYPELHQGES